MSLYGAFDKTKHFDELDSPLDTAEGVLTPNQRRARCMANLQQADASATDFGVITTVGTTTAVYKNTGAKRVATITLTDFAVGTGGDATNLAIGAKFFSLPAGNHIITSKALFGNFKCGALLYTNALDAGIGTVIGSGAVAVLGGTATFENVIGGTTTGALSTTVGGAVLAPAGGAGTIENLLIATAASHDLFLNAAGAWTDIAAAGPVTFTGTIILEWLPLQ